MANELALGPSAKTNRVIDIPVMAPQQLNFKRRSEILDLRRRQVEQHLELLSGSYEPSEDIFGLVEDNKPWWGLYGMHIFRAGGHSIDGPAKESYYLLNPFLLVAAEPINVGIFDPKKVTLSDLQRPDFPFYWHASAVHFDPIKRIATISYDVVDYHRTLAVWKSKLKEENTQVGKFSMIAYNARDFGFNYLYLAPEYSTNIKPWSEPQAVAITQMLHCGGSCGYPGGCNNMSPHIAELDTNSIKKTPARAYIKLWREKPATVEQQADMAFVIDFI